MNEMSFTRLIYKASSRYVIAWLPTLQRWRSSVMSVCKNDRVRQIRRCECRYNIYCVNLPCFTEKFHSFVIYRVEWQTERSESLWSRTMPRGWAANVDTMLLDSPSTLHSDALLQLLRCSYQQDSTLSMSNTIRHITDQNHCPHFIYGNPLAEMFHCSNPTGNVRDL